MVDGSVAFMGAFGLWGSDCRKKGSGWGQVRASQK